MYELIKYGSVGLCALLIPILIVKGIRDKKKSK